MTDDKKSEKTNSAPIQFRMVVQDDGNGNEVRRLEWRHRFFLRILYSGGSIVDNSWSEWEQAQELSLVEVVEADRKERAVKEAFGDD